MTIVSSGYDGTVDEVQFARTMDFAGALYAVAGVEDWKVSVNISAVRAVSIAPGTGYGHGILDVSDAQVVVQADVVTSGTRWDLLVMRRDWQPAAGTSTFLLIPGTSAMAVPAGRQAGAGVVDDQPIAFVQLTAGQTTPTAIVPCRTFPTKVITAENILGLPDAPYGTEVRIGDKHYRRKFDVYGVLSWVQAGADANNIIPATGSSVIVPAASWSADSPLVCRGLKYGNLTQLDINLRTALTFDPAVNRTVATVSSGFRPDLDVTCAMRYLATNGIRYGGFLTVTAASGSVIINSGYPGTMIGPTSPGVAAITATTAYIVKDA